MSLKNNRFEKNEEGVKVEAEVKAAAVRYPAATEKLDDESSVTMTKATAPAPVVPEKKKEIPKQARVKCELCNIRKAADPNSEVLKVVSQGAEFKVTGNQNGYVKVAVGGIDAFIRQDLVDVFDNPTYVANEEMMRIGAERR